MRSILILRSQEQEREQEQPQEPPQLGHLPALPLPLPRFSHRSRQMRATQLLRTIRGLRAVHHSARLGKTLRLLLSRLQSPRSQQLLLVQLSHLLYLKAGSLT